MSIRAPVRSLSNESRLQYVLRIGVANSASSANCTRGLITLLHSLKKTKYDFDNKSLPDIKKRDEELSKALANMWELCTTTNVMNLTQKFVREILEAARELVNTNLFPYLKPALDNSLEKFEDVFGAQLPRQAAVQSSRSSQLSVDSNVLDLMHNPGDWNNNGERIKELPTWTLGPKAMLPMTTAKCASATSPELTNTTKMLTVDFEAVATLGEVHSFYTVVGSKILSCKAVQIHSDADMQTPLSGSENGFTRLKKIWHDEHGDVLHGTREMLGKEVCGVYWASLPMLAVMLTDTDGSNLTWTGVLYRMYELGQKGWFNEVRALITTCPAFGIPKELPHFRYAPNWEEEEEEKLRCAKEWAKEELEQNVLQ